MESESAALVSQGARETARRMEEAADLLALQREVRAWRDLRERLLPLLRQPETRRSLDRFLSELAALHRVLRRRMERPMPCRPSPPTR